MRKRTINIIAKVSGMEMTIATAVVQKFASERKPKSVGLCPHCGTKPEYHSKYECKQCGKTFPSWQSLKRVWIDGEPVVKDRLAPEEGASPARLSIMDRSEFEQYADAFTTEYGIQPKNENSANNIRKLVIAIEKLNKVVIVKLDDTYEERIALLTRTASGRIVLKEIIPWNLVKIKDTMRIGEIKPNEIDEAKAFVAQLGKADEKALMVTDYRVEGLMRAEEHAEEKEDVKRLEEIVQTVKKQKKKKSA